MRKVLLTTFVFSASVLAVPGVALACPVCFGASDAPMALATNMGIIFMLGIVGAVLTGFATFFVYLVRRARLAEQAPIVEARPHLVGAHPQKGIASC